MPYQEELDIIQETTIGVPTNGVQGYNCSPPNTLYCNLKLSLLGRLSENDLNGLYKCTLCNECHTASLNRSARVKAVGRSLVAPHVSETAHKIREFGNPYGIVSTRKDERPAIKETVLFRGCTPTYKTPEILAAAERLLKRKGVDYGIMGDETCCGSILFSLGDRASGYEAVRNNIEKFKAAGVRRIITVCPGCYEAFNKYYSGVDGFNPEIVLAADLLNGMTVDGDYTVQDPCHAKEKGIVIRKMLPGAGKKSAGPCCGAGAGVMMHDRLLAYSKAKKVMDSSHAKIVTYCPFCYVNLSSVKPGEVIDVYMLIDSETI